MNTSYFSIAPEWRRKQYLENLKRYYGDTLNLSTLEIEKQPKFKDGDFILVEGDSNYEKAIVLYKEIEDDEYCSCRAFYIPNDDNLNIRSYRYFVRDRVLRLATEKEKKQLFDALAKEDKRWNAETKTLEDFPKEHVFKPFDKVLARTDKNSVWVADLFSHYSDNRDCFKYACIGATWRFCIPYNEQTKHLLGTTDDWGKK